METISNEVKRKIYSEYIGQQMLTFWGTQQEIETITGVVGNNVIFKHNEDSDEDETDFEIFDRLNFAESGGTEKLLLTPLQKISEHHKYELGNIINAIDGENFINGLIHGHYSICAKKTLAACQQLQEWGYDLPQELLEGKTLIESGLALDKTLI